jgi:hypothetical protein
MRRLAPLVLALLPFVSPISARADDPAPDAARKAKVEAAKRALDADRKAFQDKVNAAIDKGVAWLKGRQKTTGNFPAFGDKLPPNSYNPMDLGVNALVMLTLVKGGVPANDKQVEKLKTWCLGNYANMKGLKKVLVYPASVLLMAFEAAYHEAAKDETDVKHDRYGTTVTRKKTPCKYPAAISSLVDELAKFLTRVQSLKVGGWRYPGVEGGAPAGESEMSNTQYALLGLNAAARCNSVIPVEVWLRALDYVLKEQDKDGLDGDLFVENPAWEPGLDVAHFQSAGKRKARGWKYTPDGPKTMTTGSMTTAGIASLAIVKERLTEAGKLTPEMGHKIDSAMLDGLVWLSEVFTVSNNPTFPAGGAPWHLYYLYGLERVGALTGIPYVGKHDWYREGADLLLSAAKPDGHWEGQIGSIQGLTDEHESDIVQTCFALLFLKRATTPPIVPVTPQGVTVGGDAPAVDNRGDPTPPTPTPPKPPDGTGMTDAK